MNKHLATLLLLAAVVWPTSTLPLARAEDATAEKEPPAALSDWTARLSSDDVEVRRAAAIAARSAEASLQRALVPVFSQILKSDKDGQVRLGVLDTLAEMGPAAELAVPSLVDTLRTRYGGRRNEELHQDYRAALALAAIGAPAVEGLRDLLNEEEENVRAEAAMALGRIGPPAAPAAEALIALLNEEQERLRNDARQALGELGEAALEPLLAAAGRREVSVRAGATSALGRLDASDPRISQIILNAARDPEPEVRAAALRSLAACDVAGDLRQDLLLENLQHTDEAVRASVVNVLVSHRSWLESMHPHLSALLLAEEDGVALHAAFLLQQLGDAAVPDLLGALPAPESRVEQIAQALALMGRPIVERLEAALESAEPRVRRGAALALGQTRPLPAAAVRKLSLGLNDPEPSVQAACLEAIGFLGARARAALPAIRGKLDHPAAEIRASAISILFAAAPRDEQLIDELTRMIDDPDFEVQRSAIEAIRAAGPPGRRALGRVIAKLNSSDRQVRLAAAEMIGSHGRAAGEAVPALAALLDTDDPEFRVVATQTLSQLGTAAKPAFDKLAGMLDDDSAAVRAAALQAIGNFDLEADELRPYLAQALQDPDNDVRRQALGGIRRLGRRGTILIPDLILLAADDERSRFVRRSLRRYERYGTDARSVPELIQRLEHDHPDVQVLAIRFLGLAGPAAADAISPLEQFRSHTNQELQAAAAEAVARIKGEFVEEQEGPG